MSNSGRDLCNLFGENSPLQPFTKIADERAFDREDVRQSPNVSRNLTASPRDGAVSSPSHITRAPRRNVPTGQPVTRMRSYGVQPAREAIQESVMVVSRLRSTTVRSAS